MARAALAATLTFCCATVPVLGQSSDASAARNSVEITAGVGSAFVDRPLVRAEPRFIATAAVRSVRPVLASRISLGGMLRGTLAPVRITQAGNERNAGTTTEVSGEAIAERSVAGRIDIFLGAGVMSLFESSELSTLRDQDDRSSFHPVVEIGAGVRQAAYLPVGFALSVQGYYLEDTGGGTEGRWVGRASAGLRYSW